MKELSKNLLKAIVIILIGSAIIGYLAVTRPKQDRACVPSADTSYVQVDTTASPWVNIIDTLFEQNKFFIMTSNN